jgi:hypothetical protein
MKAAFVVSLAGMLFVGVFLVMLSSPSRPPASIPCTSPQHVGGACSLGPVSTLSLSQRRLLMRKRFVESHDAQFSGPLGRRMILEYLSSGRLWSTKSR